MLTEIGALVSIVKGLFDVAKTGTDLFGAKKKKTVQALETLQARISGLAEQLYETVSLLKTIPVWLRQCGQILGQSIELSADQIKQQQTLLTQLISDSRYDSFSDAFYVTKYDALPGLAKPMSSFRELLERLDDDHRKLRYDVPLQALRTDWATLKARLLDLRNQAEGVMNVSNELHGKLIAELKEAGAVRSAA